MPKPNTKRKYVIAYTKDRKRMIVGCDELDVETELIDVGDGEDWTIDLGGGMGCVIVTPYNYRGDLEPNTVYELTPAVTEEEEILDPAMEDEDPDIDEDEDKDAGDDFEEEPEIGQGEEEDEDDQVPGGADEAAGSGEETAARE